MFKTKKIDIYEISKRAFAFFGIVVCFLYSYVFALAQTETTFQWLDYSTNAVTSTINVSPTELSFVSNATRYTVTNRFIDRDLRYQTTFTTVSNPFGGSSVIDISTLVPNFSYLITIGSQSAINHIGQNPATYPTAGYEGLVYFETTSDSKISCFSFQKTRDQNLLEDFLQCEKSFTLPGLDFMGSTTPMQVFSNITDGVRTTTGEFAPLFGLVGIPVAFLIASRVYRIVRVMV